MIQTVDFVPDYIRDKYPSYEHFQLGILDGEILRDQYGNYHLKEEVQPQPFYGQQYQLYTVNPDIESNDRQVLEGQQFDFFNIEGVNVCFKMIDIDGRLSYISLVSAEDIARGAGLVTEKVYNDRQRTVQVGAESCTQVYSNTAIRWSTFNQYAQESLPTLMLDPYYEPILSHFIPEKIGKGSWIPTALAVLIVMRCTSKKAREFQKIVSIQITNELNCMAAKKYNLMMDLMKKQIAEQDQKLNYQDSYLNKDGLYSASVIAAQFGLTAQELHHVLCKAGAIQKREDIWIVKAPYNDFAYTRLIDIDTPAGKKTVTYWTETGRGWIHGILCSIGIFPGQNNKQIMDNYLK